MFSTKEKFFISIALIASGLMILSYTIYENFYQSELLPSHYDSVSEKHLV